MAWLGAAGIGATAGASLVGSTTRALAQTPKRGGKVRIAGFASSTSDTLDPAKGTNSTDYSRHTMFHNGLTYLDESLTPQLELAESIENDRATLWTIKLRKDVRFHDGSPLTAADVVYSLARHKDPAVASIAKALAGQMVEVKATGPNEVQIRLAAPNADLPQRSYDPDKAKFHLAKAGMAGATFPITVSPAATNSEGMAQVLQQSAKAAGLNLDLRRVPADGYWSNQWMKQPLGFGSINARPSADINLTLFFKSDAAWNESGWKNDKFDQLLVAARGEPDDKKRKSMYGDLQAIVSDHGGIGIPIFNNSLDAHSDKLKGLIPIPLGNLMGYNFAEHIWLDA